MVERLIEYPPSYGKQSKGKQCKVGIRQEIGPRVGKRVDEQRCSRGEQIHVTVLINEDSHGFGKWRCRRLRQRRGREPSEHGAQLRDDRTGAGEQYRRDEQRARRPLAHSEEDETPACVREQDGEPETYFGDHTKHREGRKTSQINRGCRGATGVESAQKNPEPGTKEERKRAPCFLFDEDPHAPSNEIFEPGRLETHPLMKVDENHAKECQTAQDIERVQTNDDLGWR